MNRLIAMAANYVKREDEDYLDVLFCQSKTSSERLEEVTRLRNLLRPNWMDRSPKKMTNAAFTKPIFDK